MTIINTGLISHVKSNRESVDHLFLHCIIAWELWTIVFFLFGESLVMLRSAIKLLARWKEHSGKWGILKIWKAIYLVLMQRERNAATFKRNELLV